MPAQARKSANKFWFVLGRDPFIAAAEISAVLGLSPRPRTGGGDSPPSKFVAPNILALSAKLEPPLLIKKLGGTVKIGEVIAENKTLEELEKLIAEILSSRQGKILFGISLYSKNDKKMTMRLGLEIKKELKKHGRPVRFVTSKEDTLSSVVVNTNQLIEKGGEFLITENSPGIFSFAKTLAVQPYEELGFRDYGRPARDELSGMLPPKLAMIMINLSKAPLEGTLLDPFCGSGTILSEAMLMGYKNLMGSDISEKAVSDSKTNVEWIADKFFPIPTSVGIADPRFQSKLKSGQFSINYQITNVQNIAEKISSKSIDAIVTEPYLGKPLKGNESKEEILKQIRGLEELYLAAFSQFSKILKPRGSVLFIIPRFKHRDEWITINIKDKIEKIGFRAETLFEDKKFLVYARPDQRVAREIWRFTLSS